MIPLFISFDYVRPSNAPSITREPCLSANRMYMFIFRTLIFHYSYPLHWLALENVEYFPLAANQESTMFSVLPTTTTTNTTTKKLVSNLEKPHHEIWMIIQSTPPTSHYANVELHVYRFYNQLKNSCQFPFLYVESEHTEIKIERKWHTHKIHCKLL